MKNIFKNLLSAVAPTIGTALGGPMGGMAAKMLSETLGVPNNQKSIEQAMQTASPEELAKIKKAELEFEAEMKKLEVDVFALEAQEKQDARKHFSKD